MKLEHKEILKQIAKNKAALAKQQQEAIQVSEYCIAEIKRLEGCEALLTKGDPNAHSE